MSPPNSSKTIRTTCGWRGFFATASLLCEQPHSRSPANSTDAKSRTDGNLASGDQATAQALGETFSTPAHDDVVVVLEDPSRERRERVHPGPRRADVPFVGHGRDAVLLEQAPVARPLELPARLAAHPARLVELADGELELQLVRDAAAPGDQVTLVRFEHADALHAAPPVRPALGVAEGPPDGPALGLEQPGRQEPVSAVFPTP